MFSSVLRLEVLPSCTERAATLRGKLRFEAQRRRAGGPFSPFRSRVAPQRLNFCLRGSTMRQISGFAGSCDHSINAYFGKPEWAAGGNCSKVG